MLVAMRTITVLSFLLAGCAATPQEVRQTGNELRATSLLNPQLTAACLRRQWEEDPSGEVHGEVVPGLANGGLELRVRQMDFGVIALYDLVPAPSGRTRVQFFWRGAYVQNADQKTLDATLAGCR
jgi:hypothetical protein